MDLLKITVVGTPCQVHTLRKMECLKVVPSHIVKYVLGLFCFESFAFDSSKLEELEEVLGVSTDEIDKMNLKEDLILELKSGKTVHINLDRMHDFVRQACLACGDFANDFADISFGGLGSPEGWTTVVIRTDRGESVYQEALRHGYIEELDEPANNGCPSEISRFAQLKRMRID